MGASAPARVPVEPGRVDLGEALLRLREEATRLAGAPSEIVGRSVVMHAVYLDSNENFTFAELVAHGGLWFASLFAFHEGRLARAVGALARIRAPWHERWHRSLRAFCETLQWTNRLIFIDALTLYRFTRLFGREPGAARLVPPSLLEALNQVHDAARRGVRLSEEEKRRIFHRCFRWEQELVDPVVRRAFEGLDFVGLRNLAARPLVRLSFMPAHRPARYRDFTRIGERLTRGEEIYEAAVRAGWKRVREALGRYRNCPPDLDLRVRRLLGLLAAPLSGPIWGPGSGPAGRAAAPSPFSRPRLRPTPPGPPRRRAPAARPGAPDGCGIGGRAPP